MTTFFNILVRTSQRPNYFDTCWRSIMAQDYDRNRFRIIVGSDSENKYLRRYGNSIEVFEMEHVPQDDKLSNIICNNTYRHAPYNLYLNRLHEKVEQGFIIYLDDDDMFADNSALSKIATVIDGDNNLVMWRVKVGDHIIPENEYFGKPPQLYHIGGSCFAFHYAYQDLAKWDLWSCSDYRVVKRLYDCYLDVKYIDEVLIQTQRTNEWGGSGKRDDKNI